ncbi:hypothetical protein M408DRAFT_328242 [Serendipita vermifera MAFF 305830]|uniref:Uncharacterized protein n=1 Tax=Serendipita vermifera MAFF 305830 TaxID=933852 RepID=A0A0C3B055_SERVB|nr:hypothetical protein M408DRAFT_328242 [Serendipita vermifera MAFF 305830]
MSSPNLQAFDPLAEYYFTSATGNTRADLIHTGLPSAAYPTHVLLASTSPARGSPPASSSKNNSVPSQTTPQRLTGNIQAPRPIAHAKGFKGAVVGLQQKTGGAIFEPFAPTRSVTPELGDVLKKRTNGQWGQWELEQSIQKQQ